MTEVEWLAGRDLPAMVRHAQDIMQPLGPAGQRRLRQFACACAWQVSKLFDDRRCLDALHAAERFADGHKDRRFLEQAHRRVRTVAIARWADWQKHGDQIREFHAAQAARDVTLADAAAAAWEVAYDVSWVLGASEPICGLLREVFGNPFRPVSLPDGWRRWNQRTLPAIASEIDEEQRYGEMPVLADALEEAGCRDEAVLRHCRSSETHVKGCWVLELLRDED